MVFIKELLPNPAGKDTAGEWVALFNDGNASINLRGFSLKDGSGKKFVFGAETLPPNQELKLPYALTRINLNNDGDTLTLYDAQGQVVDELSYSQVAEEEVVISSRLAPPPSLNQSLNPSSLEAAAFTGQRISAEQINPLLIAFGLALVFGILAARLGKSLLER